MPTPEEVFEEFRSALRDFKDRNVRSIRPVEFKPFVPLVEYQTLGSQSVRRERKTYDERLPDSQVFKAPMTLTSLSPIKGTSNGGTVVAVNGTFLTIDTVVKVVAQSNGAQQIWNTVSDNVSGTQINVVTTPATTLGLYDVVATNPDGETVTLDGGWTYFQGLRIDVVDPNFGSVAGGFTVELYGLGLFRPFNLHVKFGVTDVGGLAIDADGKHLQIVSAPAHAAGSVDVTVTDVSTNESAVLPLGFTYGSTGMGVVGIAVPYPPGSPNFTILVEPPASKVTVLWAVQGPFPYTIDTSYTGDMLLQLVLGGNEGYGTYWLLTTSPALGTMVHFGGGVTAPVNFSVTILHPELGFQQFFASLLWTDLVNNISFINQLSVSFIP